MAKTIKNTTGSEIFLDEAGIPVPASGSYDVEVSEYNLWASEAVITEITPFLNSGDLVVNDGINDLDSTEGLRHLQDPDTALAGEIKDVASVSPTTTTDATPTVAFLQTLSDEHTYSFKAQVTARRTDVVGDHGTFEQDVCVRRQSAGSATVVGDIFQSKAIRTDSGMEICWEVSGNDVRLTVTGVASKTIKWQPRVVRTLVS